MTLKQGMRAPRDGFDAVPETTFGFRKRLIFIDEFLAREQARLSRAPRVLDVGCGTGALLTVPLARRGYSITGLDIDLPSLGIARTESARSIPLVCGQLGALQSAQFDAIICSEVLEHTPEPVTFLRAATRLLRPAGLVLLTLPNGFGPYEHTERLSRVVRRLLGRQTADVARGRAVELPRGICDSVNLSSPHVQFFTWPVLRGIFSMAGLEVLARRNRTFLCGAGLSELVALHSGLVRANAAVADALPASWVSDWMIALRRRHEPAE